MRILTVVGARPQFVKAAPVSHGFLRRGIDEILVHTGQHFDAAMSQVFFDELNIPAPRFNLEIHGGGHGDMTGRMMATLEPIVKNNAPDAVLVYGDTNSTLAGALVAAKLNIPVIHVEAGLRSFNRRMPEELNRVLTDHISTVLLCPTQNSIRNLASEGITQGVVHTGDVMYDATILARSIAEHRSTILKRFNLLSQDYAVATVHRAENTDDPVRLTAIANWLEGTSHKYPIIFPIHPRTAQRIDSLGLQLKGVVRCEPLGYIDTAQLLANAATIYTDSGGIQKEAYFYRVPCVTLRDETEWVETIECGWNRLWTTPVYAERKEIPDYGSGNAAEVAINAILEYLD